MSSSCCIEISDLEILRTIATSIKEKVLSWIEYNGASLTVSALSTQISMSALYNIVFEDSVHLTQEQLALLEENGLTYNPDA